MVHHPRADAVVLAILTLPLLLTPLGGCDFAGSGDGAGHPAAAAGGAGGNRTTPGGGGAAGKGSGGAVPGGSTTTGGAGGGPADAATDGSSPPDPPAVPDAAADAVPVPIDAAPAVYPPGPYGFRVGNVVANVTLTERNGQAVTLADLRDRPGVRVILWSSGAEWCPACRGEVRKLKMLQAGRGPDGLLVLESLHQSADFRPADVNTLLRWDRMFQVNYLLTVEKSPPYDARVNNPVVLAINARTMKILSRETHAEGDVVAAVEAALAASR